MGRDLKLEFEEDNPRFLMDKLGHSRVPPTLVASPAFSHPTTPTILLNTVSFSLAQVGDEVSYFDFGLKSTGSAYFGPEKIPISPVLTRTTGEGIIHTSTTLVGTHEAQPSPSSINTLRPNTITYGT